MFSILSPFNVRRHVVNMTHKTLNKNSPIIARTNNNINKQYQSNHKHVFISCTINDSLHGVSVHANEILIPSLDLPKRDLEIDLYRKINDLDDSRIFAYMSQDIHEEYVCSIDILVQGHVLSSPDNIRYDPRFQQVYAYIQCYFECGGDNVSVRLLSPAAISKLLDRTEIESYLNTRYRIYHMILACDEIERGIGAKLRDTQCVHCIHD